MQLLLVAREVAKFVVVRYIERSSMGMHLCAPLPLRMRSILFRVRHCIGWEDQSNAVNEPQCVQFVDMTAVNLDIPRQLLLCLLRLPNQY